LARLWLDDEGKYGYVKQGPAREAQERFEERLAEVMKQQGQRPISSSAAATQKLYDLQSRVAHSRRSSCVDSVWERGRQMAYGWHPSAIRRAGYAEWAASMTTEVANSVGDALRALYSQPRFFTEHIVPLQKSIAAIRETVLLDEASIRRAAGTA
jgi:hypothetical protein